MNYRKIFFYSIIGSLVIPTIVASSLFCFIYKYDHLQIFNKGYFIKEKFVSSMREHNKGIIDNVDFDSIFLGSSMLLNSSALELESLLKEKNIFVNLSMNNARFYERSFIMNYVLKNKKLENIVYSFDVKYNDPDRNEIQGAGYYDWIELYDDIKENDILVYYNFRSIYKAMESFTLRPTRVTSSFFDRPKAWFQNPRHQALYGGIDIFVKNSSLESLSSYIKSIKNAIKDIPQDSKVNISVNKDIYQSSIDHVDINLLRFVRNNPETTFHILIPPYFRYTYASWKQTGNKFALHQMMTRYLVKISKECPNFIVYGFEDMSFLDDFANYRDFTHYHYSFNSMMNHAIAEGEHVLTSENIDSYLAKCTELAQNFDIKSFYEEIKRAMEKNGIELPEHML